MFVERDWTQMWGRWFTGAYDETGIDIKIDALAARIPSWRVWTRAAALTPSATQALPAISA